MGQQKTNGVRSSEDGLPEDCERALVARPSGVESKYNERGPLLGNSIQTTLASSITSTRQASAHIINTYVLLHRPPHQTIFNLLFHVKVSYKPHSSTSGGVLLFLRYFRRRLTILAGEPIFAGTFVMDVSLVPSRVNVLTLFAAASCLQG